MELTGVWEVDLDLEGEEGREGETDRQTPWDAKVSSGGDAADGAAPSRNTFTAAGWIWALIANRKGNYWIAVEEEEEEVVVDWKQYN